MQITEENRSKSKGNRKVKVIYHLFLKSTENTSKETKLTYFPIFYITEISSLDFISGNI